MYAEPGLFLPFYEGFSLQPPPQTPPPMPLTKPPPVFLPHQQHQLSLPLAGELLGGTSPLVNLLQPSTILEYDLGGEGDLFKAPEPILEEPSLLPLDRVSAAISLISSGDDVITDPIKAAEIESIHNEIENEQLLSDVFYECKKDLLEKYVIDESIPEPAVLNASSMINNEGQLLKSVSVGSLNSTEWISVGRRLSFVEFQGLDFEAAYGMRRAFSEGDIQKLGNFNAKSGRTSSVRHSIEMLEAMGKMKSEERKQKISRYMKKKMNRNFGRKIKYACRKALADSQPRVRGRFARSELYETSKQQKLTK
ncbi:Zinc finger protein CONSTANS-LIKE 5 [Apostasia shenzhenica]|uniref:Zinc finger protein CONSTANS-LIKE 5 n=1 Tax=Apostasia shenzhenica TaxID=1088818 RepID=A0A2I0B075_9ASPA|nr:Zinc finger protein CONSTANS-LIKE 5 [Apostasia shenzhenica]